MGRAAKRRGPEAEHERWRGLALAHRLTVGQIFARAGPSGSGSPRAGPPFPPRALQALLPATEQAPDLRHHFTDVAVLLVAQVAQIVTQVKDSPQACQRHVS